jgi:hypothetical protein
LRAIRLASWALVLLSGLFGDTGRGLPGPVAIADLSVAPDLSQTRITLVASQAVSAVVSGGQVLVADDTLVLPLAFRGTAVQRLEVEVQSGDVHGRISIEYYPGAVYDQIGERLGGVIQLDADLPRVGDVPEGPAFFDLYPPGWSLQSRVADWTAERASGRVPEVGSDPASAILALYRDLDRYNDPQERTLCASDLAGIEALRDVWAAKCFVWCTGYAAILRGFLRSAGIPSRLITLSGRTSQAGEVVVQTSEAHASVERWTGSNWAWIDPTQRILEVVGGTDRPLGLRDFILELNNPSQRDQLVFTFEAGVDGWVTRPYPKLDPAMQAALGRYYTLDKSLTVANGGFG